MLKSVLLICRRFREIWPASLARRAPAAAPACVCVCAVVRTGGGAGAPAGQSGDTLCQFSSSVQLEAGAAFAVVAPAGHCRAGARDWRRQSRVVCECHVRHSHSQGCPN